MTIKIIQLYETHMFGKHKHNAIIIKNMCGSIIPLKIIII
jgi:hypothetical protein